MKHINTDSGESIENFSIVAGGTYGSYSNLKD